MPHFMIVTSPYYEDISSYLLEGAEIYLDSKQVTHEVVNVPGALEIPLAIKLGIESGKFDGYIALGCVIRGETSHYDIVCNESARGLSQLTLDYNAPIGNGILTCDTAGQAVVRADPHQKNKGKDAAEAAHRLYILKNELSAV